MYLFFSSALIILTSITVAAQELPDAPQSMLKSATANTLPAAPAKQPWATRRQLTEYAAVIGSELGDAYSTELCQHAHNGCRELLLPQSLVAHPALMYSYSAFKAVGSIYLERRLSRTDMAKHHKWVREGIAIGQASHVALMVRQDHTNAKAATK